MFPGEVVLCLCEITLTMLCTYVVFDATLRTSLLFCIRKDKFEPSFVHPRLKLCLGSLYLVREIIFVQQILEISLYAPLISHKALRRKLLMRKQYLGVRETILFNYSLHTLELLFCNMNHETTNIFYIKPMSRLCRVHYHFNCLVSLVEKAIHMNPELCPTRFCLE